MTNSVIVVLHHSADREKLFVPFKQRELVHVSRIYWIGNGATRHRRVFVILFHGQAVQGRRARGH